MARYSVLLASLVVMVYLTQIFMHCVKDNKLRILGNRRFSVSLALLFNKKKLREIFLFNIISVLVRILASSSSPFLFSVSLMQLLLNLIRRI